MFILCALYTLREESAVEIARVSRTRRGSPTVLPPRLAFAGFIFGRIFFSFLNLLVSALSELLPRGDKQEVHCARDLNGSCPGRAFGDVRTGSHSFQMWFWSTMCLDYIILFSFFLWGLTFPPDNTQILRSHRYLGKILPVTDFTKLQSSRRKIKNHIVFVLVFCFFSSTLFYCFKGKVICCVVVCLFVCFCLILFFRAKCFFPHRVLFLFRGPLFLPALCRVHSPALSCCQCVMSQLRVVEKNGSWAILPKEKQKQKERKQ